MNMNIIWKIKVCCIISQASDRAYAHLHCPAVERDRNRKFKMRLVDLEEAFLIKKVHCLAKKYFSSFL